MSKINNFPDDSFPELDLDEEVKLQKLLDQKTTTTTTGRGAMAPNTQHLLLTDPEYAGFDTNTADSWIFPKNLPMRAYQYSIAQASLYRNTLVVLPTGLGKTFIAAVVMYNIYRWYPTGKVIFMAPTRPLVAQQIKACQQIMPFPGKDIVELTGKLPKQKRIELWRSRRVFFATPQVVHSDIVCDREGNPSEFPFNQVKLLVIDEAHKAKGRYAYTEVTQTIFAHNHYFRMLALSATPGRSMEDVATICRNLYISHVEVRWDTSIDVLPYVHTRSIRTIEVPLSDEMREIYDRLVHIIDPYVQQLIDASVLSGSLVNLHRNFLLYELKRFNERHRRERHPQHSMISTNFSICISLYYSLELLERHGLRVFVQSFDEGEDGKSKFVLTMDASLRDLVDEVKQRLGPNPFDISTNGSTMANMPKDFDFGHPKFEEARKCLLKHFEAHPSSRAIVFCEYRESVMLIYRLLLQHVPLLKPRCFVGQGGSSTGSIRALTQKQQIQIMSDFRSGTSNILVATSIAEEGIDVGEVELIVCFDVSTSNPTRFVQRIGRTGRKKNGNVVILVTEGREAYLLKDVLANKDQTNKKILQSRIVKEAFYKHAPRMVPTQYSPKCVQTLIEQEVEEEQQPPQKSAKKAKNAEGGKGRKNKKDAVKEESVQVVKGSQDLRRFFKQTQPELNAEEREIFECDSHVVSNQVRDQLEKSLGQLDNLLMQNATEETRREELNGNGGKKVDATVMRKLNKLLQSNKPLLTAAQCSNDLWTQLKSKSLPKHVKQRLLQLHLPVVRELCAQMQVLQSLEVATNEMSREEQHIRKNFDLILAQFDGDTKALTEFLEAKSSTVMDNNEDDDEVHNFQRNDLKLLAKRQEASQFEAAKSLIFADLAQPDYCADNFDFLTEAMKALEQRKAERRLREFTLCSPRESMVYNNTLEEAEADETAEDDFSSNQELTESRYQSQWEELGRMSNKKESHNKENISTLTQAFRRQRESHEFRATTEEPSDLNKTSSLEDLTSNLSAFMNAAIQYKHQHGTPTTTISHCSTPTLDRVQRHAAASTPLATINAKDCTSVKPARAEIDLLSELDNDLEAFIDPFDFEELPKQTPPTSTSHHMEAPKVSPEEHKFILDKLELNEDDFLDPFSEEEELTQVKPKPMEGESKKPLPSSSFACASNWKLVQLTQDENKCQSPDLFNDTITPVKPLPMNSSSLAAKLAAKCKVNRENVVALQIPELPIITAIKSPSVNAQKSPIITAIKSPSVNAQKSPIITAIKSPSVNAQKSPMITAIKSTALNAQKPPMITAIKSPSIDAQQSPALMNSPQNRLKTDTIKYEKSPSVFDLYLHNMRGRAKLPKAEILAHTVSGDGGTQDESIIGLRRRGSAKRKIIESDSSPENAATTSSSRSTNKRKSAQLEQSNDSESNSDWESIPATQLPRGSFLVQQRNKRRKFNSFILGEAEKSGDSDGSEDEAAEHTIGTYLKDSVIVSSTDEDSEVDQEAHSRVQAMYLQAVRSPHRRHGAFKIPAQRRFSDEADIFSQEVEPESQYMPDSFIAEQDDSTVARQEAANATLCPLERAEKILKERRRMKRRLRELGIPEEEAKELAAEASTENPPKRRRRRVQCISLSSSDDD